MPSTDHTSSRRTAFLILLSAILLPLGGCISLPGNGDLFSSTPEDAVPRKEPRSKKGNMPTYVVFGKRYYTLQSSAGFVERGIASWYGPNFHGKKTSNGETFDMHAMTAAHTRLPLPTYVRVTNLENGKHVTLRVNDRGPFKKTRIIDLSKAAAAKLGIIAKGTGLVEVRAVDPGRPDQAPPQYQPIKGDLYIQVGAYGDPANAQTMRNRMSAELGQSARIAQSDQSGQALYRVQVGPFRSVAETDRQAARILAKGIDTYIIID